MGGVRGGCGEERGGLKWREGTFSYIYSYQTIEKPYKKTSRSEQQLRAIPVKRSRTYTFFQVPSAGSWEVYPGENWSCFEYMSMFRKG